MTQKWLKQPFSRILGSSAQNVPRGTILVNAWYSVLSGNWGWADCSTKRFTFVEQSPWNNRGYFWPSCPAGLDPASQPVKGVGTQRVALEKERMSLRVKPAKTQIVSYLQIIVNGAKRSYVRKWRFRRANQRRCSEKWGGASFSLSNPWWLGKYAYLCAQMLGSFLLSSPLISFSLK